MSEVIIRKYKASDKDSVRKIAFDTALMGEPASAFFDDEEIMQDILTGYFLDYEPQSCWVAESEGKVIGYLMGAIDEAKVNKISGDKILPKVLFKAVFKGIIFKKKCLTFIIYSIKSLFKGEFKSPHFYSDFPAVLHINIVDGFRSQGIGSKLIAVYLDYLKSNKIKGVHFATLSDKAAVFYEKLGFSLLYKKSRSYLRYALGKDINCYVYGMKLTS